MSQCVIMFTRVPLGYFAGCVFLGHGRRRPEGALGMRPRQSPERTSPIEIVTFIENVLNAYQNFGSLLADVPGAAISSPWDFRPRVLVIFFRFIGKGGA